MNQDILFIQNLVSKEFNVPLEEMTGKSHYPELMPARHCAMYWCKKFTKSTLSKVASHFNRSHHTSIRHAIKKYKYVIYKEREDQLERIEKILIEKFGEVNYLPKWSTNPNRAKEKMRFLRRSSLFKAASI